MPVKCSHIYVCIYMYTHTHIYANFKNFNCKAKRNHWRGILHHKWLTFRPSLAWQFTFRGVSKAISFSSLPLLQKGSKSIPIKLQCFLWIFMDIFHNRMENHMTSLISFIWFWMNVFWYTSSNSINIFLINSC